MSNLFDQAYAKTFHDLYRGIIVDNKDPKNVGRCRIRVPSVHGPADYSPEVLPWARPLVLSPVKKNRGSVNLPDEGDIVWVFFEGGDKKFPVYLGGTYAIGDIDIKQNEVDFYVENTDKISYERDTRHYLIQIGETYLLVFPEGVTVYGNTINFTGRNISLNANTINFTGDVHIHGDVSLNGNMSISDTLTVGHIIVQHSCNLHTCG